MGQKTWRGIFYAMGLAILSLGIILNTKTGLGVTPIISVPYAISQIGSWNFGNVALLYYVLMAGCEYVIKGKNFQLYDLLQIPLSFVFTRAMNLFAAVVPDPQTMPQRALLLVFGVVLTGIGAAMNVDMRLVPQPGDGIVQAISDRVGKSMGFCKNCFDLGCVTVSVTLALCLQGEVIGIGIGTLVAVLGVGRTIAAFNFLCGKKITRMAGVELTLHRK